MKRRLTPETVSNIERCINRGNAAVVKVEHCDIVVLEEKRTLFFKEKKEENPTGLAVCKKTGN